MGDIDDWRFGIEWLRARACAWFTVEAE